MRTQIILIATVALLNLSGTAIAQDDPHHPAGAETPAAIEPQTPTDPEGTVPVLAPAPATATCPAAMPMMEQMMQAMPMMQMMQTMQMQMMQMMQMEMMERGTMGEARRGMTAPDAMLGKDGANPELAFAQMLIAHYQSTIAMAKTRHGHGADQELTALLDEIIATQEAEIEKLQKWLDTQTP